MILLEKQTSLRKSLFKAIFNLINPRILTADNCFLVEEVINKFSYRASLEVRFQRMEDAGVWGASQASNKEYGQISYLYMQH